MIGTLAELYLQTGDYPAALDAFEALAELPQAAGDPLVQQRVELLRQVAPLAADAQANPSLERTSALADALWEADARELAVGQYFTVLTEYDPQDPVALGRVGEVMFLEGRSEDAMLMLQRARASAAERDVAVPLNALLFLGNAAFAAGDLPLAIDAWEDYLAVADDPGRVPQLIERARAIQAGEPDPGLAPVGGDVQTVASGPELYQAACASCHGAQGGGGSGPALAGNPSVGRVANVEDLIRYGRGLMPGFQAQLDEEQITTLRDWVVATFAP
jgi:mono/diheme cytochrome c family protein